MSDNEPDNQIARRTAKGSMYSVAASMVTIALGFVRSVLLLRWLFPEHFGVAALALFYLNLAGQITGFGIDGAFVHRKDEDEQVRRTYFTLRLLLGVGAVLLLLPGLPLLRYFYPEEPLLPAVLGAYMGIHLLRVGNLTQVTMLSKRLAFRHIAVADVASSIVMTIVAPYLAWRGFGVWSIVAEQLSGVGTRAVLVWFLYRAWQPRLGFNREIGRWFWQYGSQVWWSGNWNFLLDRFDDWFTGTFLGSRPLGFYAKAYEYARYPRRVIANPILAVFFPAFAQLQDDRPRLSRAFFRATSLMLRVGGLFSLVFIFTAPEFIPLVIGDKWLPMLLTFQLMIVYTLLDPLSMGANNLLMATGYPNIVRRVRLGQVIIFIPTVVAFGSWLGIEGVALAADLMIAAGTVILYRQTRLVADYSQQALWLWPLLAMALTAVGVLALDPLWSQLPLWGSFLLKLLIIPALFGGILWLTEREQLRTGRDMIWGLVRPMLKRAN